MERLVAAVGQNRADHVEGAVGGAVGHQVCLRPFGRAAEAAPPVVRSDDEVTAARQQIGQDVPAIVRAEAARRGAGPMSQDDDAAGTLVIRSIADVRHRHQAAQGCGRAGGAARGVGHGFGHRAIRRFAPAKFGPRLFRHLGDDQGRQRTDDRDVDLVQYRVHDVTVKQPVHVTPRQCRPVENSDAGRGALRIRRELQH